MSGETESQVSGWTTDTLKELHDREIRSNLKLFWVVSGGVATIIALGWNELQRRLITLNHAHEQQVQTLAATVSSDKYESDKEGLDGRLVKIEAAQLTAGERERSGADAASRAAGAAAGIRAEQRDDIVGKAAAHRQTIALILSATAIIVSITLAIAVTRSHTKTQTVTTTQTTTETTTLTTTVPAH